MPSSSRLLSASSRIAWSLGAQLLVASSLVAPSLLAQSNHAPALSPMPLTDVTCASPVANAKGKPLKPRKDGGHEVQLTGKYPPRIVKLVVGAGNQVLEFHSAVNWTGDARGSEHVDVMYKSNGQVKSSSRTLQLEGKPATTSALLGDDNEEIVALTRDILKRCG